jgi:hypothetical protein
MPIQPVPVPILTRFDAILEKRTVAPIQHADYKKWLRYFLDYGSKPCIVLKVDILLITGSDVGSLVSG